MVITLQPLFEVVRSVKNDLNACFTQLDASNNFERIYAVAVRVLGACVCFQAVETFVTFSQTLSAPLVTLTGLTASVFIFAIGHDIMMLGQAISDKVNDPNAQLTIRNSWIVALLDLI